MRATHQPGALRTSQATSARSPVGGLRLRDLRPVVAHSYSSKPDTGGAQENSGTIAASLLEAIPNSSDF